MGCVVFISFSCFSQFSAPEPSMKYSQSDDPVKNIYESRESLLSPVEKTVRAVHQRREYK